MIFAALFCICILPVFVISFPTDTKSNGIGLQCSNNTKLAWLDIVFAIDTSSALSNQEMREIIMQLATISNYFNIGQNGSHTTRIALISFASNVEVQYQLKDTTDFRDLFDAFEKLIYKHQKNDSEANINGALIKSYEMLRKQKSYRKPVTFLVTKSGAHNSADFENVVLIANTIKDDGFDIVAFDFESLNDTNKKKMQEIASQGYFFNSDEVGLFHNVANAFTQINCFCPNGWSQFIVNTTKYAECLWSDGSKATPKIANIICQPGNLVYILNQKKLDFVTDYFIAYNPALRRAKNITIGLHKSASDGEWKWWGYNGTEIPYENYPPMTQILTPNDNYGYMWNHRGLLEFTNWIWYCITVYLSTKSL